MSHQHCKGYMATFQLYITDRGRPLVPLHALFPARAGIWVDPLTFRKLAGQLPHKKEVPGGIQTYSGDR